MDKMMSKKQVLEILGITMNTLDLMMKKKEIPYYKMGERTARVRFSERDLKKYIKNHKVS